MATSKNKVSAEIRIKRFLYLCSEDPKFVTGNPEVYKYYSLDKIKSVIELIEADKTSTIINIIEIVNSENSLPRRETLFYLLAVLARNESPLIFNSLRSHIYTVTLNCIKTIEDFFDFIKFYTLEKKSFPSGLNKLIRDYYLKKEPFDLAKEISNCKGLHGWTHKDLIKLSHCKTDNKVIGVILMYVLFGLKKAETFADENPDDTGSIIDYFRKINEIKKCKCEKRIAELSTELKCGLNLIPSDFLKSQIVWEALLPNLPIKDLIRSLPKLYKLGFLKANTQFQTKVVDTLTNSDCVKSSKIHPVEVFLSLRNFEKGGKPLDPQFLDYMKKRGEKKKAEDPTYKIPDLTVEAPKCPAVISALYKTLQISLHNPHPLMKKIMITFDTTEKMRDPCLHYKNISCLEAAVIMALSILKVERDVVMAVFNDNEPISILQIEKNATLNQALTKLKESKCKHVVPSSPIEWALSKKKSVDVFVNFTYNAQCLGLSKEQRDKEKSLSSFNIYKKKMSLPNTKLITFSLSSHHSLTSGNSQNTLDICGFSENVPKIFYAFIRGLFN